MDGEMDDDVLVETVDDNDNAHFEDFDNSRDPGNTPQYGNSWYSTILSVIVQNGWLLLFLLIIAMYIWSKLQPKVYLWKKKREEDAEAAAYHKDPDLMRARFEAMEASRQRLQQEHDIKAAEYAEKVKEREEAKRQLKIEDWQRYQDGKGYRSRVRAEETEASAVNSSVKRKKPKLRPEYHPLIGDGAGTYRPNMCGGGMEDGGG